ncbi:MAG: zf-HC2 domain-containing protein [Ignavibacteriae bacterium]|nr:zf-HC2 domain-containing protein [Ignavibacteriota bacterium]
MKHLTSTQIQEYLDGLISGLSLNEIELHLRTCQDCQSKLNALKRIDRVLHRIQLERVSPSFTERVMKQLNIKESSSLAWTIFKNIAPLFALMLVTGIVLVVMYMSGALQGEELQQPIQQTQSVYNGFSSGVSSAIGALNEWISRYFSFAFARTTYGTTFFLIVFFSVVALLDKFLLMPMMRKRG